MQQDNGESSFVNRLLSLSALSSRDKTTVIRRAAHLINLVKLT